MPTARVPGPTRPVSELLLEIAYYMHTTRVVGRRPRRKAAPKVEPRRPSADKRPVAPPCHTAS